MQRRRWNVFSLFRAGLGIVGIAFLFQMAKKFFFRYYKFEREVLRVKDYEQKWTVEGKSPDHLVIFVNGK